MAASLFLSEKEGDTLRVCRDLVHLRTEERTQFIDLTELVAERVRRSGVSEGLLTVQSRHTTASVVVNENEPRLLEDLEDLLERWAPRGARYRHNDLGAREGPLPPDETPNGHAHAQALVLGTSVCFNEAAPGAGAHQGVAADAQDAGEHPGWLGAPGTEGTAP